MKAITFVIITLVSGAIAGTILGIINQALVEPYIDRAISIETQNAIKEGEVVDPIELRNYRLWQKGGEIAAATILGISFAALFAIVFVYSRSSILPHSNSNLKKSNNFGWNYVARIIFGSSTEISSKSSGCRGS